MACGLLIGPMLQWPALVALILALAAGTIWFANRSGGERGRLWPLALSPLGWLAAATVSGWAVCDRMNGDRCGLAGGVWLVAFALILAGLGYGVFLIVRLKGVRYAPCAVFIVNLGYSLFTLLAAAEAASGVGL